MAETGTDETVCYRKAPDWSTPTAAATVPRLAMPRLASTSTSSPDRSPTDSGSGSSRPMPLGDVTFVCVPRINAKNANRARRIRRCSDCRDRDNRPESSVHSGKMVNPFQNWFAEVISVHEIPLRDCPAGLLNLARFRREFRENSREHATKSQRPLDPSRSLAGSIRATCFDNPSPNGRRSTPPPWAP